MKDLVAYFSASGSTAKLAGTLASAAGAELYEILPAVPYERRDLNWMDKKSRSTLEMQDRSCRPPLADADAPVAEAERIFLGSRSGGTASRASSTAFWTPTTSPEKRSCPSSPPAAASSVKGRRASKRSPAARGSCPDGASARGREKRN